MRNHCRYYPANSVKMRVKLAQILIRDFQRQSPRCVFSRRSHRARLPQTWKPPVHG